MTANPLDRFTARADDYARHRPSYPSALFDHPLIAACLRPQAVVADIGAGTGIFSRLLAERVGQVVAVEPNHAMRARATAYLAHHGRSRVVEGTAEATGLDHASVDAVTAAQAFHWFDRERFRSEARRILRRSGQVLLIWNRRSIDGSPAMAAYEALIDRHLIKPRATATDDDAAAFFHQGVERISVTWLQTCDRDDLLGRARSSSTIPTPDHPRYATFVADFDRCFAEHERHGRWNLLYDCRAYLGRP